MPEWQAYAHAWRIINGVWRQRQAVAPFLTSNLLEATYPLMQLIKSQWVSDLLSRLIMTLNLILTELIPTGDKKHFIICTLHTHLTLWNSWVNKRSHSQFLLRLTSNTALRKTPRHAPGPKTNIESKLNKSTMGRWGLFVTSNMTISKTLIAMSRTLKFG